MPTPIKYAVGTKWGKRRILARIDSTYVTTVCECGKEQTVEAGSLKRSGSCQSCARIKHGQCGTRLYKIWSGMRKRCKDKGNKYYGGKGISICQDWEKFVAFLVWAKEEGYNESMEIHRIEETKNYCPQNCMWLTKEEHIRAHNDIRKLQSYG